MKTANIKTAVQTADYLENLVANIGASGDATSYNSYKEHLRFSRYELEALYSESWIGAKVVDIVPNDATREWRTISAKLDPEQIKTFEQDGEEEFEVVSKFNWAAKLARLFGGAGIVMGIDEAQGGHISEPLDVDSLGVDCLKFLHVIENERLVYQEPVSYDPNSEYYSRPEYYRLAEGPVNEVVHASRILFFYGNRQPYYAERRMRLPFWGHSIFTRLFQALTNADLTMGAVATLVTEASVDVVKYQGLAGMMGSPGGQEAVTQRFALAKLLKSVNNVMLLDQNEEFDTHSTTFSGIAEVLDRFLAVVSGAADIPVTRLIGTAAKGLNATGDGDLRNYYDNVRSYQNGNFNKPLKTLDKVLQSHLFGSQIEDWGYTWDPLFQISELDQASSELARAQKDQIYSDMGAVDAYVVAKELSENSSYTNIDEEFLNKVKKETEEMKSMEMEALAGGMENQEDEGQQQPGGESIQQNT